MSRQLGRIANGAARRARSASPARADRSIGAPSRDAAGGHAVVAPALPERLGNQGMQAFLSRVGGARATAALHGQDAERAADAAAVHATTPVAGRAAGGVRTRLSSPSGIPAETPPHVRAVISEPGERLPPTLGAQLGDAFGADFSDVSVHRTPAAARSAALLGAQAYTLGRHVAFGTGQFAAHSAGGQRLVAHELAHVVQQRHGGARLQLKAGGPSLPPLEVVAEGFDEAAANFAAMLALKGIGKARIVIVNGPNVRVYDQDGKLVDKKFFHLTVPTVVPIGVFVGIGKSGALHALGTAPDGSWKDIGLPELQGWLHFSKNVDDQEGFDKATKDGGVKFYVSPTSTATPPTADAPPPAPIENLPEFMQFEAKTKANLPPWPSATVPLTPQLATVNSTGTFVCRVDKAQGTTTLDRVTNVMQPTSFRWEVLKLDEKLRVAGKSRATGWDAAVEGFARRKRQLADDKKAMIGNTKRQSIPETVFRTALAEQTASTRHALAMVGQTVMTAINAITGGPNQMTTEDVMDVPFKEQGDYFVRCLATQVVPKDAKYRRATSVSGVMVSVYDIEDVTRDSLQTGDELTSDAQKNQAQIEEELRELDAQIATGEGDLVIIRAQRAYKALTLDYFKDLAAAGGNPLNQKVAEQTLLRSQVAFFEEDYPQDDKYVDFKKHTVKKLEERLTVLDAEVKRMRGALTEWDAKIDPIGYMRAVLVDEVTAAKANLTFAVGERQYIAADKLEVVIADVTGKEGRTFSGSGSGSQGAGREDAWLDALTDLRQNLNRGRGWLGYEVPKEYSAWKSELPNPMKLEMSLRAQMKETVDDAAHALTVAAILAAPFTGGASLSILAVLAPIQAASSLYNIVNRSMYGDLRLDEEAVFDLINVATLGLGKLSTVGKAGSRGLEIIASSSRVAIKLINGGQFVVVSYQTFNDLMAEGKEGDDPREIRRKKLRALLNWCEQAAIPVSEKLFAGAHGPGATRPDKTAQGKDATLYFDEPMAVTAEKGKAATKGTGKDTVTVHEGTPLEPTPAKKPVKTADVEAKPTKTADAEGKPAKTGDVDSTPGPTAVADVPAAPTVTRASKAQLKGIPASLHDKVAVVEGLGKDAKIVYKRGDNGLITDIQIQIGAKATAADIKTHAAVAEMMLKYSGVGGRIRRLLGHFIDLFAGPEAKRPEIGSPAWEAKFELVKLDRMMRERHAELAKIADLPAAERDAARQRELASELDSLEQQYLEHQHTYNAIEMATGEGRGYVAAEGLAAGETERVARKYPEAPDGYRWRFRKGQLELVGDPGKTKLVYREKDGTFVADTEVRPPERFDAGTNARKAFRELGGYEPKSSFGSFVEILLEQGLIKSRQEVIDAMGDPANRTHDNVRGKAKDAFREKLVAQITSPAYLKKTARYKEVLAASGSREQAHRAAAIEELNRISARIDAGDRGSLGERVYDEVFGTKKGVTHVEVTPAELAAAKGVDVADIEQGRSIDRMDGTTAREVKNVTTLLGPRERGQISDMLDMVGAKVQPKSGAPRQVERIAVAFVDPKGGAANARLAHNILKANADSPITFEFHTKDGRVISVTAKNMDILLQPDFATKLGLPPST